MMNALTPEKSNIERKEDLAGMWMIGGMLAVFAGVVIETVPEFLGTSGVLLLAHRIGGGLVASGLAVEFVVQLIASKYNRVLREINASLIAETNGLAARAEQAAAEATLARAKLEHRYAARRITGPTNEALRELLPRYAGKRVDIFLFDTHVTEVKMLGDMLHIIFLSCGWDSRLWVSRGDKMTDIGFTFGIASEAAMTEEDPQPIARELAKILNRSDIPTSVSVGGFSRQAPVSVTGDQGWNPNDVASLRIEIGEKTVVTTLDLLAAYVENDPRK
jgi:hypothetical protein